MLLATYRMIDPLTLPEDRRAIPQVFLLSPFSFLICFFLHISRRLDGNS
jgi:hypothetical protein